MKQNFKINTLLTLPLAIASIFMLSSCEKTGNKSVSKSEDNVSGGLSIAYVNMDSISKNYTYAKDIASKLEKDSKDAQAQLESKVNAFQTAAQDFQRKVKINAFVSQQAAESAQAKVLNLQQEAQQMEAQLQQTLAQKQILMTQDMLKDIQDKIKEYNKDGKYNLILTSSGLNNILYAEKSMDITSAVLKYLNDHYKVNSDSTENK